MSSLQISNTIGINNTSNHHRLAVGIDLGTTNSLVAAVCDGQVRTLADANGRHLLPSVVYYRHNGYTVGYDAKDNLIKDPVNTASSIKRMMGRSLTEIKHLYPYLPYNFKSNENDLPLISTNLGLRNPIDISADILKELALRVFLTLKRNPDGVVITVPAYFDDAQRQGTRDAAQLAGLHVLRLLNEPTAAAIAYGLNFNKEGIVAVYDLGGGTFDISILHLRHGFFEVLATGGDSALGGDDFDYLLANFIREKAGIINDNDIYVQQKLLDTAVSAKVALSKAQNITINFAGWKCEILRDQFNELISPLVKRTLLSCHRTLNDAGIEVREVQEVIMVGGSTYVPLIRERVHEFFGRIPLMTIDPEKVVAIGAAIQADFLIGNKFGNEILLLDVMPLSLGLETIGGLVEKIIPRNSTIPVECVQEFTTIKNGQTAIVIHVVQGEREMAQDCRSLARFVLRGIPVLPAGKVRIRVIFQVDADGLLNVTAIEESTGIKASTHVRPSYGLTDKKITAMIQDSMVYTEQDTQIHALVEQKTKAIHILESLNRLSTVDDKLSTAIDSKTMDMTITALRTVIKGNDIDAIKKAIEDIEKQIQNFLPSHIS